MESNDFLLFAGVMYTKHFGNNRAQLPEDGAAGPR